MRRILTQVTIDAIDSRGRGRGTTIAGDGTERPVIVTGALPGDVVDVQLTRRKAGSWLGEIAAFHSRVTERRTPFCPHFGTCGGCTIQDLAYESQLAIKHEMVAAAFAEVPELAASALPSLPAVLPAPAERRYRNKLEFSFGAQRWLTDEEIEHGAEIADRRALGFHVSGRFDRVLDITECHLQPDPSEEVRTFLREYALAENLSFYHAREHHGLLRTVMVRTALTGESMVVVMFGEDDEDGVARVMGALAARFPEITSLGYVINTSRNDSIYPHDVHMWSGEPWITERCGPNTLRIRPKAFYQTNPGQAVRLYEHAMERVGFRSTDVVYDLYSGIGSIALFCARDVKQVIAIESVPDAVHAARENAELNGITNVQFELGEVETILPDVAARYGAPDAVIVDPPRVGLHPRALTALHALAPATILYISCNPRTQARDLAPLIDDYEIESLQPVDMFPQTRHVENIAVLRRRSAMRD